MRIAKNTEIIISEAPTSRFLLVIDVMDGDVLLTRNEKTLLSVTLDGNDVVAHLFYPDGREAALTGACARGKEVILTAGYARIGLYVGGVLLDEDFFFTPLDYRNAKVQAGSFMHFEAGYEYHSASESAIVENVTDMLDGYLPAGTKYGVVRTMPCLMGDRISLLYLDERRNGQAKDGRGARKVCALFSDDGVHFHSAPIALAIDNVREDSILDAALLRHDGRYYLYYLVAYSTHKALSCAVSEDGFSFIKTGLDVEVPDLDPERVTALSVFDAEVPKLYFVSDGDAYVAESIDLLHFSHPTRLSMPKVERLFPLAKDNEELLYVQKEGTLFLIKEGDFIPVSEAAAPLLYRDTLCLFGAKDGHFTYTEAVMP